MSAYSIATRGLAGRKIPQGTLTLAQRVSAMFSCGKPGAWYGPSDLSTLFQDETKDTPVTAVEQPVGLMLDKSGRGNHAWQATTTKRPVLSRRVNLLTKTEDFQAVAWITPPSGTVKSNNAGADPLGGGTAGKVECTQAGLFIYVANAVASGLITGATYRVTCHIRNGVGVPSITFYNGKFGSYKSATINLTTGAVTGSNYATPPVVSVASDGWVKISVDIVAPATDGVYCYVQSSTENSVGDHFFIWHPSLTLATDAHLSYQWVNTDTDYDADPNKFPAYLRFDGVDDALQTGDIDFTSTDKMTVWAGVLRTLTSTAQEICGLTAYPVNAGAFTLWASTGAEAGVSNTLAAFSSAISGSLKVASQPLPNNTQAVLNGYQNSTGVNVRLNSGAISTVAAIPAANFADAPIYIGSRAGTSNFLNGRLYSLIVRGAQTPLSQIEATELYIKQKMRMP